MAQTIKSMIRQLVEKYPDKHIYLAKKIARYAHEEPKVLNDGYELYVADKILTSGKFLTYKQLQAHVKMLLT